jgi:protein-S-isoprenylcysteine O-methyltransferase Ste14
MICAHLCFTCLDGGLILASCGLTGLSDSVARGVLTALLFLVLRGKVEAEETFLKEMHGAQYDEYSKTTRSALLPFIEG